MWLAKPCKGDITQRQFFYSYIVPLALLSARAGCNLQLHPLIYSNLQLESTEIHQGSNSIRPFNPDGELQILKMKSVDAIYT
jgi:hypothetical protein